VGNDRSTLALARGMVITVVSLQATEDFRKTADSSCNTCAYLKEAMNPQVQNGTTAETKMCMPASQTSHSLFGHVMWKQV
jgi:hypothetical protein